jgi:hypothetical protein
MALRLLRSRRPKPFHNPLSGLSMFRFLVQAVPNSTGYVIRGLWDYGWFGRLRGPVSVRFLDSASYREQLN